MGLDPVESVSSELIRPDSRGHSPRKSVIEHIDYGMGLGVTWHVHVLLRLLPTR